MKQGSGIGEGTIFSRSQLLERYPSLVWWVPLCFVGAGVILQYLCRELVGERYFLFLYPAVVLGVFFGKRSSNIIASFAALAGALLLAWPVSFNFQTSFSFGIFFLSCLLLSFASEALARAEEQLRVAHAETILEKEKFEGLFRCSPAMMALVRGPELIFEKTNTAYQEAIGNRDVVGKGLLEALPELENTPFPEALRKVLATGEPLLLRESRNLLASVPGEPMKEFFLDFTYQRLLNSDGSPYGVLGTAVDVSDQVRARQHIANQKNWLQLVLDRIESGVVFVEPKSNNITFANRAAMDMTDHALKPLQADYPLEYQVLNERGEVLPPDLWPRLRAARGETIEGELFTWKTPRGIWHYLIQASQVPAAHGQDPVALISLVDLSELKKAERTITRLTDSNIIGILNWKLEGEIVDANDAFLEMLGYTREDLEKGEINWQTLTPSEWKHADLLAVTEMLTTGSHRPYEKEYLHKDGHPVPILIGSAIFEDSANSGVSFIINISEQRRIQEELSASENRFRTISESLPQLVWTANAEGEVTYYNHRIGLYAGARTSENRWEWELLIHPDDVEATEVAWSVAVNSKLEYQCQHRMQMKDGSFRWHLSRGTPLLGKDGKLKQWFGTATDIHDQISTQSELSSAKEEAERANRLKSAFLANMSHEIRTPLGAILGFADLLRDRNLSAEEHANYLNIISSNGEQLSSIINDILDLSKIEAGHMTFEYLLSKPEEIAREVLDLLRVKADEKSLSLEFICESSTPAAFSTDPLRLRQILINVLGNAIKFTPSGTVKLRSYGLKSATGEQSLYLEVSDTGIGIAEEAHDKIFLAFVQADGSLSRRFGGTGLGLALSRQLARQLRGDLLLVQSAEGRGSTFSIQILDQPSMIASTDSVKPDVLRQQEIAPNALNGLKILVVDDSLDNRRLIGHLLTKLGAAVEFAENGLDGYRKALIQDYDLVLMDIQMPEMDGYTATQKLRDVGYIKPVIALTAHAMSEVRRKCLNVGYTDHLTKPIKRRELIETVLLYTSKKQGALSSIPLT